MNSFPKIKELSPEDLMPERHYDFYVSGEREQVAETCARDYASCQCWDYIIAECTIQPGLWFIWQEEKGGAEA